MAQTFTRSPIHERIPINHRNSPRRPHLRRFIKMSRLSAVSGAPVIKLHSSHCRAFPGLHLVSLWRRRAGRAAACAGEDPRGRVPRARVGRKKHLPGRGAAAAAGITSSPGGKRALTSVLWSSRSTCLARITYSFVISGMRAEREREALGETRAPQWTRVCAK